MKNSGIMRVEASGSWNGKFAWAWHVLNQHVLNPHGTARHVLEWHVLNRHGTARFEPARHGTLAARHDSGWHGTKCHGTSQHGTNRQQQATVGLQQSVTGPRQINCWDPAIDGRALTMGLRT